VLSGLYELLVILFGAKNVPATYQRQNDNILREYLGKFIIYYLDDILIYSEHKKNHEKYISLVLEVLFKIDSRLKLNKYKFNI
jgi:hypothetical protein